MELLFSPDTNRKILLTASSSGLYSHLFQNERFLRSSLLCSNYECGLSGVLYHGALHYAYITKEHSLLLRCIGESSLQFRLDGTEAVSYHSPQLAVFVGCLLLAYFECIDGAYHLQLRTPFATFPPIAVPSVLPVSFAELPDLRILPVKTHLYLLLSAGASSFLFRYNTSFVPEVLCPEEELLSENDSILSDTKAKLRQSEERLHRVRNQLAECDAAHRKTLHNLTQTTGLLERAKAQYEELMQVALQYKEEATKWYRKFTDRN